jgi:hypothetical protein
MNRPVTFCGGPCPDSMNGLPDVTLKRADVDTVPDTVPPRVVERTSGPDKVRSTSRSSTR